MLADGTTEVVDDTDLQNINMVGAKNVPTNDDFTSMNHSQMSDGGVGYDQRMRADNRV